MPSPPRKRKHIPRQQWLPPHAGYTARPPLARSTGIPAAKAYLHATEWRRQGMLAAGCHPPDKTYNGGTTADPDFYIIYRSPNRIREDDGDHDPDLNIAGIIQPWHIGVEVPDPRIQWYKVSGGALTSTPYDPSGTPTYSGWATYGDISEAELIQLAGLTADPNGASFVMGHLDCRDIMVASLGLWWEPVAPENIDEFNCEIIIEGFERGNVIRGASAAGLGDPTRNSLGQLLQRIGDGTHTQWGVDRCTSRVLFQWNHGIGWYCDNTGGYVNIFGNFTFKFQCRNPQNKSGAGDKQKCLPVMVVSGGAEGDTIKLESTTAGDTWEYTFPAAAPGVPTLIAYNSANATDVQNAASKELNCDIDAAETVTVSANVANGGEVYIHSLYLEEAPGLVDV